MPTRKKPTQTKAAFVRSLSSLKPKEILKRAQAAGVKLTIGYIYNVRGATKAKSIAKRSPATSRVRVRAGRSAGLRPTIERMAQELAEEILAQIGNTPLSEILTK